MNILEDEPVPYTEFQNSHYASPLQNIQNNNNNNNYSTTIHFFPCIPIEPIPSMKVILSEYNYKQWMNNLPLDNIKIKNNTIFVRTSNNKEFSDSLPDLTNIQNFVKEKNNQNIEITIHIYYSLCLNEKVKLKDTLSFSKSLGENDLITNRMFSLPESNPQLANPTRNRIYNHRNNLLQNLLGENLETFITTLINPIENTYDDELAILENMGFTNRAVNIQALERSFGDIQQAIEFILRFN